MDESQSEVLHPRSNPAQHFNPVGHASSVDEILSWEANFSPAF